MKTYRFVLVALIALGALTGLGKGVSLALGPDPETGDNPIYLPLVTNGIFPQSACETIPGASFDVLTVLPPPSARPAARHPDLNLDIRGFDPVAAHRGYIWLDGPTDLLAPKLPGLFDPPRHPAFISTSQVYEWDWECDCRTDPLSTPRVTLATMQTAPLETIHVPSSGYDIGDGYEVLVLYAEPQRITLKYTREDNVIWGYTLHLENICVEADLLVLYEELNAAGRAQLPALESGQPFARARGNSIGLAIRDTGSFMDPRSYKDWW